MSVISMFIHIKSIELSETCFLLIDFGCNETHHVVSAIAKHRYHCNHWLIVWKIWSIRLYIPPIECPTQWNLFDSNPNWNNFVKDLPACFAMIDERMTAEWRTVNEYWPQSRIIMLWSLRLMYDSAIVWIASLSKSSIQPETKHRRKHRIRVISMQKIYDLCLTRFIFQHAAHKAPLPTMTKQKCFSIPIKTLVS